MFSKPRLTSAYCISMLAVDLPRIYMNLKLLRLAVVFLGLCTTSFSLLVDPGARTVTTLVKTITQDAAVTRKAKIISSSIRLEVITSGKWPLSRLEITLRNFTVSWHRFAISGSVSNFLNCTSNCNDQITLEPKPHSDANLSFTDPDPVLEKMVCHFKFSLASKMAVLGTRPPRQPFAQISSPFSLAAVFAASCATTLTTTAKQPLWAGWRMHLTLFKQTQP